MELSGAGDVFLVGLAGSAAVEVLHWWNLRKSKRWPRYASRPGYWALTIAMIGLGGLITWLQFGESAEAWIAFQIGAAAPVIVQKLATATPEPQGGMNALRSVANWRDFLTW